MWDLETVKRINVMTPWQYVTTCRYGPPNTDTNTDTVDISQETREAVERARLNEPGRIAAGGNSGNSGGSAGNSGGSIIGKEMK